MVCKKLSGRFVADVINNKLSSEVATEIFRINDINGQFLLGKKRNIMTRNNM